MAVRLGIVIGSLAVWALIFWLFPSGGYFLVGLILSVMLFLYTVEMYKRGGHE